MDLKNLLSELKIPESYEVFKPHWEESVKSFSAEKIQELFSGGIEKAREYGDLPAELDTPLIKVFDTICKSENLALFFWHCHNLAFEFTDYKQLREWPYLDEVLGEERGLFYLLVVLSMIDKLQKAYRKIKVPEDIIRHIATDVNIHSQWYRRLNDGRWGFRVDGLHWIRNHATGIIFRIGRLQYIPSSFKCRLMVFQNVWNGSVVALAGNGLRFDSEGYPLAGVEEDQDDTWHSEFVSNDSSVTGYPVDPRGFAIKRKITLSTIREWTNIINPDSPVLDIHIPAGDKSTVENWRESMLEADKFFKKYFSHISFSGFRCTSWLFNTQFEQMLNEKSSILQIQRQLYLFPTPCATGKSGLSFIFDRVDIDVKTAPRDTSLRRAVLEHLESGKLLRSGGMFVLPQHADKLGTEYYQKQFPDLDSINIEK